MAEPGPRAAESRSPVSRWLSRVDELASRPLTVLLVVGAAGAWIVVSLAAGFPARWETVFHATGHQHGKIRQAALDEPGSAGRERPEG